VITSSTRSATEAAPVAGSVSTSEWRRALRYLRKDVKVIVGCIVLGLLVLTALLAPVLAPYDPNAQEFDLLLPPSWPHILGTDEFGRDLLSRLMAGARVSLVVGFAAVGLAVLASVPLGLISGYYGGWVDTVIMRYIDLQWAFPSLIIAVGLMAILGPGPAHRAGHRERLLCHSGGIDAVLSGAGRRNHHAHVGAHPERRPRVFHHGLVAGDFPRPGHYGDGAEH